MPQESLISQLSPDYQVCNVSIVAISKYSQRVKVICAQDRTEAREATCVGRLSTGFKNLRSREVKYYRRSNQSHSFHSYRATDTIVTPTPTAVNSDFKFLQVPSALPEVQAVVLAAISIHRPKGLKHK
jgi:hypothetical protein